MVECENILKKRYNIPQNEELIIFKTDKYIEGLLIPLIEYEIFNSKTKEKLDLYYYCKYEYIDLTIPVSINDNYSFKYDPNNSYYKNICINNVTKKNIDISLYDRQKEFNDDKISICPNNCIFNGYDSEKKKSFCKCQIQERISLLSEINKEELIYKFFLVKNITNFYVLKCFNLLFSKEGFAKNIGSYFIIFILLIYIISAIFVYVKGYSLFLEQINNILDSKVEENDNNSKKDLQFDAKENSSDIFSSSKKYKRSNAKNNSSKLSTQIKVESDNYSNNKISTNNPQEKKEIVKTEEFLDYEINTVSYQEALENDKRTYFQYYISLIKAKHILIFTFNLKKIIIYL